MGGVCAGLPAIEKVPSMGMRKSLSVSRLGVGIDSSTWLINSSTASLQTTELSFVDLAA